MKAIKSLGLKAIDLERFRHMFRVSTQRIAESSQMFKMTEIFYGRSNKRALTRYKITDRMFQN